MVTLELGVEGPLSVRVESQLKQLSVVFRCCDNPQSRQPHLLPASPHPPPSPRRWPSLPSRKPEQDTVVVWAGDNRA